MQQDSVDLSLRKRRPAVWTLGSGIVPLASSFSFSPPLSSIFFMMKVSHKGSKKAEKNNFTLNTNTEFLIEANKSVAVVFITAKNISNIFG
jgi:hypothetical protein